MRNRNIVAGLVAGVVLALAAGAVAKEWPGFSVGMGMGGWLTNYKRFNVLPENKRLDITKGDLAHFDTYITEGDVQRVKMWGFDHIRLGFDQIVLEEAPGKYRERTMRKLVEFVGWCRKHPREGAAPRLARAAGPLRGALAGDRAPPPRRARGRLRAAERGARRRSREVEPPRGPHAQGDPRSEPRPLGGDRLHVLELAGQARRPPGLGRPARRLHVPHVQPAPLHAPARRAAGGSALPERRGAVPRHGLRAQGAEGGRGLGGGPSRQDPLERRVRHERRPASRGACGTTSPRPTTATASRSWTT